MNSARPLAALALASAVTLGLTLGLTLGCGKTAAPDAPPVPASSDPEGKDLVEGAVVGALEKVGGIRLYKITHVEDLPDPMGTEYDMIAYNPKAATYEEAQKLWSKPEKKIALEHLNIRAVDFLPRQHRVLRVEPLTDAERATYTKARDSRSKPVNGAELPQ